MERGATRTIGRRALKRYRVICEYRESVGGFGAGDKLTGEYKLIMLISGVDRWWWASSINGGGGGFIVLNCAQGLDILDLVGDKIECLWLLQNQV